MDTKAYPRWLHAPGNPHAPLREGELGIPRFPSQWAYELMADPPPSTRVDRERRQSLGVTEDPWDAALRTTELLDPRNEDKPAYGRGHPEQVGHDVKVQQKHVHNSVGKAPDRHQGKNDHAPPKSGMNSPKAGDGMFAFTGMGHYDLDHDYDAGNYGPAHDSLLPQGFDLESHVRDMTSDFNALVDASRDILPNSMLREHTRSQLRSPNNRSQVAIHTTAQASAKHVHIRSACKKIIEDHEQVKYDVHNHSRDSYYFYLESMTYYLVVDVLARQQSTYHGKELLKIREALKSAGHRYIEHEREKLLDKFASHKSVARPELGSLQRLAEEVDKLRHKARTYARSVCWEELGGIHAPMLDATLDQANAPGPFAPIVSSRRHSWSHAMHHTMRNPAASDVTTHRRRSHSH